MEYQALQIAILLGAGLIAGVGSGLLGLGGGFIMIPVQYWVMTAGGVDSTVAFRVALGTNLLVVLPTALSGALAHHRKGAVVWRAAVTMGLMSAVGAFMGAFIATRLPGAALKLIFGAVTIVGAVRMLTANPPKTQATQPARTSTYILWGLPIGVFSGVVGIAGGIVVIPVMVFVLKFSLHQAVATSTAMMIFTTMGGAFSFLLNGLGTPGLPPHSIGYVNWLQWILLAGCSIPMATVGARIAHRLPARRLNVLFVMMMFYVGLKMSGVLAWLHLPI